MRSQELQCSAIGNLKLTVKEKGKGGKLSRLCYFIEATESEHKSPWSKFDDLPLEEKRELYKCGSEYVTLKDIQTWPEYRQENLYAIYRKKGNNMAGSSSNSGVRLLHVPSCL